MVRHIVTFSEVPERLPPDLETRQGILEGALRSLGSEVYDLWVHSMTTMDHPDTAYLLHETLSGIDHEQCGNPVVSVPPSLAEALMLTDLSLDVVEGLKFPWTTFRVQTGTLIDDICISTFTLKGKALIWARYQDEGSYRQWCSPLDDLVLGSANTDDAGERSTRAVGRLVAGIILMSQQSPERLRSRSSKSSRKNKRFGGLPQTKDYVLDAKGIQLKGNLSQGLKDLLDGKSRKKANFTTQWVVRGHWRNQPCGPNLSERRATWIQPYWKGHEEAPRLFKTYNAALSV